MTDINKELRAILINFAKEVRSETLALGNIEPSYMARPIFSTAQAKIKALVVESIKDEVPEKYDPNLSKELRNIKLEERRWLNMRNKLRGEIRSILNT